jgi:K+/H+ antiporter YhaU regulatory subunit KhtT
MAAKQKPNPIERKVITVNNAPPYVRELLNNVEITIPIYKSWAAIDAVFQEATRNIATLENQNEIGPTVVAINHNFTHFRMMRDQGKHDVEYIEKQKAANQQ